MDKYNMVLPRITYSGVDALENLRQVVAGRKKAAIFTDKGILGAGLVDLPQEIVHSAGVETVILSDIPAEPSYGAVQTLVDEFRTLGADIIIAVGGGSAMDTAKLASILYGVEGVKNCHLLTPDEDVSVSATELPVLGTVTITEIGAGEA